MQILVNTDNNIRGSADLSAQVEAVIENVLGRFGDRLMRVEVRLTDDNSAAKRGQSDKRCVIEARVGGLQPVIVSDRGETLAQALDGAADAMQRSLDSTLERLSNRQARSAMDGQQLR